jgi:hypothetical protein
VRVAITEKMDQETTRPAIIRPGTGDVTNMAKRRCLSPREHENIDEARNPEKIVPWRPPPKDDPDERGDC